MIGRIIYLNSGMYRVKTANGIFEAKPIGIFRNKNIVLIVGDIVELELNNAYGRENLHTITKLFERKNHFERPKISNIDQVIIVTSLVKPEFNHYYLNKLIAFFQYKNLKPILIFTKFDLDKSNKSLEWIEKYKNLNYEIFVFANKFEKNEAKNLINLFKEKFTILTGQSGVGKSTILNFLNPNLNLKIDKISTHLNRGKHTTRHYEAFEFIDNGFIVDSPGFSSLDLNLKSVDIAHNFLNFKILSSKCSFQNCIHKSEVNCNVKENVDSLFYKDYLKLINEINFK